MHSKMETEAISDSVQRKWGGSGSAGAKSTEKGVVVVCVAFN